MLRKILVGAVVAMFLFSGMAIASDNYWDNHSLVGGMSGSNGIPIKVGSDGTVATSLASGKIASGAIASGAVASGAIASGAVASGAVASGAFASGAISDGADVTLGAKADNRATTTDTTAVTIMQVLKEISYMEQNPASRAVTGTVAVSNPTTTITTVKKSDDSTADIPVAGTATIYTKAFAMNNGSNCTVSYYAYSATGSVDVTIQLEQSFQLPAVEGNTDAAWAIPVNTPDVVTTFTTESAWSHQAVSTTSLGYARFKITGIGANNADTIVNIKVSQKN